MDPIFYNQDGSLTKYALSCGYIQKKGKTELYQEHTCYHLVTLIGDKYVRMTSFSLTEARKFFRQLRRMERSVSRPSNNSDSS